MENFLTACDRFCLSHLLHQYTGLLWSNKCNNNNAEITPFISVLVSWNLHMSQTPVPPEIIRVTYKLHPQGRSCFCFFFYTSGTPHARHIRTHFELWGGPFRSSLFASFFLLFGVAMKGIHSTQLRFHISFISFIRLTTCFLSSRGWLLDSRERRLFCLHIHHASHCLFEQWTLVCSLEAVVCVFCLSILLQ